MRVVEVFCGIGLSSLGHVAAGHTIVAACDIEKRFVEAYNQQTLLPPVAEICDTKDFMPPPCDMISGGPVCKAFSPGALIYGSKGKDDDRNTFPNFIELIERVRPRYMMFENSAGLRRHPLYMLELEQKFSELGYKTAWSEIDCYDFGVAQHRHRIVCVGRLGDKRPRIPAGVRHIDAPKNIGQLMWPAPSEDPWNLLEDWSEGNLNFWKTHPVSQKKHPAMTLDRAAPTVVSMWKKGMPHGVVVLPDGSIKRAGPRLAARIQGMPDAYNLGCMSWSTAMEGIGNGFPPPAVQQITQLLD